jgi:hypothetical protein
MFKMNDIMIKKAQDKQQVEQPFVEDWKKHYQFSEFYICIYIIYNTFLYDKM